ncbi:MAG: response regulator [Proteobacteria bacterium]|nr:response regulator [Pseudomonadota bacterium]
MSDPGKKPNVLCVDDEPQILEGLQLHLRRGYRVSIAASGAEGLARIREEGPFVVVISDMRMPEMSGAEFLARVRTEAPDTVRILLTGQADVESTVQAVNEGGIFRFLTKPCPPDRLRETVAAAVEQWRLVHAERELLEGTLRSSVRVLTESLGLVSPPAFNCASRLENVVAQLSGELGLPDKWQYEVAAMLSQMGCISLPVAILDKCAAGEALDADEERAYRAHPSVASELIGSVPRLETVAEMIRGQLDPVDVSALPDQPEDWEPAVLGSQLLRAGLLLDRRVALGRSPAAAVQELRQEKCDLPDFLMAALENVEIPQEEWTRSTVTADQLVAGMVLDGDARGTDGLLVAAKGTKLSPALVLRLRNFASSAGLEEPLRVLVGRTPSAADGEGS